jgi:hypothetical protein
MKSPYFLLQGAHPESVLCVDIVVHVGPALVELESGGLYFLTDGCRWPRHVAQHFVSGEMLL